MIQQKILSSPLILVHSGRGMRPKQCLNLVLKSYDLCGLNPRAPGRTRAGLSFFPSALFFSSFFLFVCCQSSRNLPRSWGHVFFPKVSVTCHVPRDLYLFSYISETCHVPRDLYLFACVSETCHVPRDLQFFFSRSPQPATFLATFSKSRSGSQKN